LIWDCFLYIIYKQHLLCELTDKETQLHKLAKKQEDLSIRLGIKPSMDTRDVKQAAQVISELKYKAMEAKNHSENAIEKDEFEKTQSNKLMKLPTLPVLPARVGELQQQIALHNVNIMLLITFLHSFDSFHVNCLKNQHLVASLH